MMIPTALKTQRYTQFQVMSIEFYQLCSVVPGQDFFVPVFVFPLIFFDLSDVWELTIPSLIQPSAEIKGGIVSKNLFTLREVNLNQRYDPRRAAGANAGRARRGRARDFSKFPRGAAAPRGPAWEDRAGFFSLFQYKFTLFIDIKFLFHDVWLFRGVFTCF